MTNRAKVAFVTGVNGVSGNAIVEHLIRTPKTEWLVQILHIPMAIERIIIHFICHMPLVHLSDPDPGRKS